MYLRMVRPLPWAVCFMIDRSGAFPSAAEGQAGAQRVAGVAIGVQPGQPASALHDQRHRLLREPGLAQLAVAVDRSKHRPSEIPLVASQCRRPRTGQVSGCWPHGDAAPLAGALLVGLAAAEVNDQPMFALLEVANIEGDQLAAAQAGGEAEQEESPLPGLAARR